MSQVGVAVVGTGFGQKVHIPGLQAHHLTEVVAVWNRDMNKARAVADECGAGFASDRLSDILAQESVQAVTLATPPFTHYEMAKEIIEAGKHLLLEKPVTLTVDEARDLRRMAQEKGVVVVPDFEFRFIPEWQYFAELLSQDIVGEKRLIKIDWLASSRANPQRAWNWYAQKEKGGGALGSIGSHAFDYANWLFGPAKEISAVLSTSVARRPDAGTGKMKEVDSDDVGAIALTLADGTLCQITLSAVSYGGRGHWVEVYGEKGALVLGNGSQTDYVNGFKVFFTEAGGAQKEMPTPERLVFPKVYSDGRIAPFIRVVDHWTKCIEFDQVVAPGMDEGVYSQLLMDLTHRSSEEGVRLKVV